MMTAMHRILPSAPGLFVFVALLVVALAGTGFTSAQQIPGTGFGLKAQPPASSEKMTVRAGFRIEKGSRRGILSIEGEIAPGWHCNSLGQVGGTGPLVIKLADEGAARLGDFTASAEPEPHEYPDIWPDVLVFEHGGSVTWSAPVELLGELPVEETQLAIRFNAIVCSDACIPVRKTLTAGYLGELETAAAGDPVPAATDVSSTPAAPDSSAPVPPDDAAPVASGVDLFDLDLFEAGHGLLSAQLLTPEVQPGGRIRVRLLLEVTDEYHAYRYFAEPPEFVEYTPTLIRLQPGPLVGAASVTSSIPHISRTVGGLTGVYYPGNVEFTVEIQVPEAAPAGNHSLEAVVGFQTCKTSCDQPAAAFVSIPVRVGISPSGQEAAAIPLQLAKATYSEIRKKFGSWVAPQLVDPVAGTGTPNGAPEDRGPRTLDLSQIQAEGSGTGAGTSLPLILLISLGGGFILNFMPCVLPVIGLKVMSFMQQAGQNRWQALGLNIWYTLGILSVFMILATLATFFNFGWGKQSQSTGFQIGLASVVFVMSLSFLGVWEIPIPGFVGSSTATRAAEKEGVVAAFLKGVLTTILAVPCSGPGISVALTWCVGKPPHLVFLVFGFLGLGMALPYVVIGIFPGLLRALPRPGLWMETFKEIMGFVLLGTVIWLLWTVPTRLMLPSFAFLFALWFACWWYGRTPIGISPARKLVSWTTCLVIGVVGWFGSFSFLASATEQKIGREFERRFSAMQREMGSGQELETTPMEMSKDHLPWQPFSIARLAAEVAGEKTVVVDFTADWCLTCKTLEKTVLNTAKVRDWVDEHGLVMLMADWTEPSAEIDTMLQKLGSEQIPVLAIFPAGRPNQPIVLMGGYTQNTLLEKLREAGASKAQPDRTAGDTLTTAQEPPVTVGGS